VRLAGSDAVGPSIVAVLTIAVPNRQEIDRRQGCARLAKKHWNSLISLWVSRFETIEAETG
jgi:hypothetical protein